MIKIIIARIDIINKKQYEESERYKEIKITFPKDEEELKKDFEYLELNYHNLTIQDTNIVECIFIDREDEDFVKKFRSEAQAAAGLMNRGNNSFSRY